MREVDNFCVGCPQGCINCGRKNDVLVITCDRCGDSFIYDGEVVTDAYGYEDLCRSCFDKLEDQELNGFFDRCEGCECLVEFSRDGRPGTTLFICSKVSNDTLVTEVLECPAGKNL